MIRLIVAIIGLFILWVLFFSNFSKNQKILLTSLAVLLSVLGFWYESSFNKARQGVVTVDQVVQCGISVEHVYRSNFDIALCIRNNSTKGYIKRIELEIYTQQCLQENCIRLESITRDLRLDLRPESEKTLIENLSFKKADKESENINWDFNIKSIHAFYE